MFCAKCGKDNLEHAKFCEFCGNSLIPNNVAGNVLQEVDQPFEIAVGQEADAGMAMMAAKPVSKWNVVIVFEIIAVIALIYGGKVLGDRYYSPAYLASQYFESLVNGHPDKAYEYCLKNEETDFISKDMYCSIIGVGNEKIIGYSIEKKKEDFLTKIYTVTYRFAGDDEKQKMTITMEKNSGKKKFFLFDDWKVSMAGFTCKDYKIIVPKDAEVKLDQVALTGENAEKSLDEETGCETYKISSVFSGDHVIEISKKYYQDVRENIHISWDAVRYRSKDMYLEKSVLDKLAKDAQQKFKYIMQGAVNGDYTSVINKCVAKEGRELAINTLQWMIPDRIMELELTEISYEAVDGDYEDDYGEYYEDDYEEGYGDDGYAAYVEATAAAVYYGWDYDSSMYITAKFYYGLDEGGKFEIERLEFLY